MYEFVEAQAGKKKERHYVCKNIALSCPGWESNPQPLAQDAKIKGLFDLHKPVRLDVIDWQTTHVFECQPPKWGVGWL